MQSRNNSHLGEDQSLQVYTVCVFIRPSIDVYREYNAYS